MDSICFFPKSARVWSNSCPRFHRDVERLRETSEDRDDEKGEVPAPVARDAGEPVMWPHGLRFQVSFTISQGGAGVGTAWRGDAGLFPEAQQWASFYCADVTRLLSWFRLPPHLYPSLSSDALQTPHQAPHLEPPFPDSGLPTGEAPAGALVDRAAHNRPLCCPHVTAASCRINVELLFCAFQALAVGGTGFFSSQVSCSFPWEGVLGSNPALQTLIAP